VHWILVSVHYDFYRATLCYRIKCCRRCVRLSVRLSQAGIVPKRLNTGSRKQRRAIAQGLVFDVKNLGENSSGVILNGAAK